MSKKDYENLARELHLVKPSNKESYEYFGWYNAVKAVSRACKGDNYRFKEDVFLEACGVK